MQEVIIACRICGGNHSILANEAQVKGLAPVILVCPEIDRRYRLTNFYVDTRRSLYDTDEQAVKKIGDEHIVYRKQELGDFNFEEKFERWKSIDYPGIGLIEEYPEKISQIINAYCIGYSYPATTSACCLAERILNRLILKCRDYFKTHPKYKKIYQKESFDNWDTMLKLIEDWQLIPVKAIDLFNELKPYRNQTVHYSDGYDFDIVAPIVINKLIAAIAEVFGVMNRTDLYLVFDVPGEVWVRAASQDSPFVKEFVIPHCYYAHAVHELEVANKQIVEKLGKVGKLTDEQFVQLRINQGKSV